MSALKPELDKRGVTLLAIAGERLGHEEFLKDYWKGELLFDEDKEHIWPVMGSVKKGFFGVFSAVGSYVMGGKIKKDIKRCEANGVKGDLKGEGMKLGGVWVIGSSNQGVLFQHNEKEWGDIVLNDAVLDAVEKIHTTTPGEPEVTGPEQD